MPGFAGFASKQKQSFGNIYHHVKSLLVLAGSWHWVWDISREGYFAQQQSKGEHHWLRCIVYDLYMTGLAWYSEKNCPHLSQISWALIASAVFKRVQPPPTLRVETIKFSRAAKSCMHVCNAVTMRCYHSLVSWPKYGIPLIMSNPGLIGIVLSSSSLDSGIHGPNQVVVLFLLNSWSSALILLFGQNECFTGIQSFQTSCMRLRK